MKVNKQNLSTLGGKQRAVNNYKQKLSRFPNEADLTKDALLENRGTMKQ